jgi:branched-chain amino acid transport system permease protein
VGAYTVGLFTSLAEYGLLDVPFWVALPFAMLFAATFGAILGLPILSIRGDYLAIATLGFGEIIRLLAGSDVLKPSSAGPRGIVNIPSRSTYRRRASSRARGRSTTSRSCSRRSSPSWHGDFGVGGSGRAWIAIREDEDVPRRSGST